MSEAKEKARLTKKLKKTFPAMKVLRHEDHFTAGIPDVSISRNGQTLWLEIKFARMKTRAIQRETLRRLIGFFVMYKRDSIVEILLPSGSVICSGLGDEVVLDFVRDWFLNTSGA